MQAEKKQFSQKYNGFFTKNDNYVWGGAMCLAWNQLKDSIIKAPIQLNTNENNVIKMIDNFNTSKFTQKDIDPACVYVKSGYGQKTLDQINAEVNKKFPEKTTPPLNIPMKDDSIISYAYLLKKLSFITKFERLPDKNFTFNNDHKVHAFYADKKEQRKQIQFCEYEDTDNFTIAIKSKNPKDLLFCVKSQKNLLLEQVFKKCDEKKLNAIGNKDEFMMPVIELDLHHSIEELKLAVKNKGFEQYFIQQIFENVKLKIDESGAKVENEAVIMMNRCMPMSFEEIKQFHLDKPFWIIMKQQGKHPYLAVYVRNPVQTQ